MSVGGMFHMLVYSLAMRRIGKLSFNRRAQDGGLGPVS
jgi:hypothetical protein